MDARRAAARSARSDLRGVGRRCGRAAAGRRAGREGHAAEALMAFVIDQTVDVAAPHAVVWRVVTDLARYGEWNPFVVACRSTLAVGDPIEMSVRLVPWITQPQRETIVEHESGKRLCYGLDGGVTGAIVSRRCHELAADGDGRTRYRSHFELSGWMAPVVRALLGGRLVHGFQAM